LWQSRWCSFLPKKYKQPAPLQKLFPWMVKVYNYQTIQIFYVFLNASLMDGNDALLCSKQTQGNFFLVIYCSEDHSIPVLHVTTCLSCIVQVHSLSIVWNICAINKPSEFCITSQELKCSPTLSNLSFHHDIYSLD